MDKEPLKFANIARGALEADFNAAMEEMHERRGEGATKVTVEITFPELEEEDRTGIVPMVYKVKKTFPAPKANKAVAFEDEKGKLVVDAARDDQDPRQHVIPFPETQDAQE